MMLVLPNITIEPSFVRKKKIFEPPNVSKLQSHVILDNLKMIPSNVRKKYEYNRMWQKYYHM